MKFSFWDERQKHVVLKQSETYNTFSLSIIFYSSGIRLEFLDVLYCFSKMKRFKLPAPTISIRNKYRKKIYVDINFGTFVREHNWKACDSIPRLLNVQFRIVFKWKLTINIIYFPIYCRFENNIDSWNEMIFLYFLFAILF